MSKQQTVLNRSDLEQFSRFLKTSGWRTELPKDSNIVLQASLTGRKQPLIIRSQGTDLIYPKRDKTIVRAFLRSRE